MIGENTGVVFREEDHTYWKDGVRIPGFHEAYDFLVPTKKFYKNPSYYAWRGKSVHKATALHDTDSLDFDTLDFEIRPFFGAYVRFLNDHETIWLAAEEFVFHPVLRYAGIMDRYGMLDDQMCVLDIKCGVPVPPLHAMQLCAYSMCLPEVVPHWYVLYLSDKGTYKLKDVYDETLRDVWAGAMRLYWWRKANA